MEAQWSGEVTRIGEDGKRTVLAACSEATALDTAEYYRRENGYTIELTMELLCDKCGGSGLCQARKWSILKCKACKGRAVVGQIFDVR